MNQTFDHSRLGARPLSRPGFDIIRAVAGARQAACPTAQRLNSEEAPQTDRENAAVRRALLGGGLAQARHDLFRAARFFEADTVAVPQPAPSGEAASEINAPFTRAFQSMLKPLNVGPVQQADRATRTGSIME